MNFPTKILISSNVIFILISAFLYFGKTSSSKNLDNSAIISGIIESQKKSLDELNEKLNSIDEKHDKLIKDYQQSLDELNKKYDQKVSEIEKDRNVVAKKIVSRFNGDVIGLAGELSKETGIKVVTK